MATGYQLHNQTIFLLFILFFLLLFLVSRQLSSPLHRPFLLSSLHRPFLFPPFIYTLCPLVLCVLQLQCKRTTDDRSVSIDVMYAICRREDALYRIDCS